MCSHWSYKQYFPFLWLILQSAGHKAPEIPKQVTQMFKCKPMAGPMGSAAETIRADKLEVQSGSSNFCPGLGAWRDTARFTWWRPVSHLLHKWGTNPLPDKGREGGHSSHPSHQTISLKQVTSCHPRELSDTSACSSIILNCKLIRSQKLSLGVTGFSGELKFTWKNSKSFKQNYTYNLAK